MNPTPVDPAAPDNERWWQSSLLHDFGIATLTGLIITAGSIVYQSHLDDKRQFLADEREDSRQINAARQENLRFVRERSSSNEMERPFSTIDLENQNLAGLLLDRADFSHANLKSVEFSGTQSREANLIESDLAGASMTGSDFSGAMFLESDLSGADLSFANFSHARFYRGNLTAVNLSASNFQGAVFENATLDDAYLINADLRGADLSRTSLDKAIVNLPVTLYSDVSEGQNYGPLLAPHENMMRGICYDSTTKWPEKFEPPKVNKLLCERWDSPEGLTGLEIWSP